MKNIVVAILMVLIIGVAGWVASNGGAYNGGEHGKVIADMGDNFSNAKTSKIEEKDDRQKENDKLNALRDKAGNIGTFKVSQQYKSKCASCHGANGSGFQNGRKMMGPPLFGQTSEEIYTSLVEFKSGRKENVIMKGLLINTDESELRVFADEIGEFTARAEANK